MLVALVVVVVVAPTATATVFAFLLLVIWLQGEIERKVLTHHGVLVPGSEKTVHRKLAVRFPLVPSVITRWS